MAWHLQVDLQGMLDGPLRDHLQLHHAPLDLCSGHHRVLEDLSIEFCLKGHVHFTWSSRALFAGRCDEAGEVPGLYLQAVN